MHGDKQNSAFKLSPTLHTAVPQVFSEPCLSACFIDHFFLTALSTEESIQLQKKNWTLLCRHIIKKNGEVPFAKCLLPGMM